MARPPANPADLNDPLRDTINQVHTEALDYAEETAGGTLVVSGNTFPDIQSKVDAAAAAGGGTVLVPQGLYTGTARIELKDNVTVRGAGQGATVLRATTGIVGAVVIGVSSDTISDAFVQDLTLDANNLAGINGFQVSSGTRVTLARVTVINAAIGIWLNLSADCKLLDGRVFNCSTRGIETSSIRTLIRGYTVDTTLDTGITITGATDCRIESCRVATTGNVGPTKHGIDIKATSDRAQVVGTRVAAAGGMGIHADASTGLEIFDNTIDNAGGTLECVGLTSTCTDSRVVSNRMLNGKDNGLSISAARCTVSQNIVDGAQFMGIQVNADNVITNGNVVRNSGKAGSTPDWAGIDLNTVQHCIVVGNRCFDDQGTKTQKYGINERGTSNNNTIGGNDLAGNLTAPILMVGADTVLLSNQRVVVRNQAAPYTVAKSDEGLALRLTAAGTITMPDAANVPNGFQVGFFQSVTGTVTFAPAVAGQILSRGAALNMGGQYAEAWIRKDALEGKYVLVGDLA